MEEILASIRRIIADDDASKAPEAAPAEPPPLPPPPRPVQQVQPEPPVYAAPPPPPPPPRIEPEPPPMRIEPELPPPELEEPMAFAPETVAEQSADILDLTESMATSSEPAPPPQFRTIDGHSDVGFDDAPAPPSPPPAPFPPAPPRLDEHQERLLSNASSAAVDSAFNALAQTVLSQNARTLEDLVREMLRPMLKSWLDDNLPGMVERMVRAEIERVSRGRPS
jgi:cell pole-organizing protein PopZ